MPSKSAKITPEHHRLLKVQSAEHQLPLQEYLELLLDLALSQHPLMKYLREQHLKSGLDDGLEK